MADRDGGKVRDEAQASGARGFATSSPMRAKPRTDKSSTMVLGQTKGGDGQAENGLRAVSRRDDKCRPLIVRAKAWAAPQLSAIAAAPRCRCGKPRDHFL